MAAFLEQHPVFDRATISAALGPKRGHAAVTARLRYYRDAGRLVSVSRGVYAAIPLGVAPESFQIDPFLVAAAARADSIFSHHSALELLGSAHSAWNTCTAFSAGQRLTVTLRDAKVRLLPHPTPLAAPTARTLGTRTVERRGTILRTTGPERTLVEGFRQLDLVGGIEELLESAAGFDALDVPLLTEVLERYALKRLWAAVGWFLESHAESFCVRDEDLRAVELHRPSSPLYLDNSARGGTLASRWNLVLPPELDRGDPDAGES